MDTTNRIVINGNRTPLAVVQRAESTVVYTPESRLRLQPYVEHPMPHKRYALTAAEASVGVPDVRQFEADVKALLGMLISATV